MRKYIYTSDIIKWIDRISGITKSSYAELEKLQDEIIKSQDVGMAYFFASEFKYKTYRMQKVILDAKSAKYAFLFARNIPNADIKALQNIIIYSNKIKYIADFVCHIVQANRKLLIPLIIKSK